MAHLHQIVGALIRDIALARVSSDMFSRDVSRYYEADALLRRFPTPRTEIDDVEVDLKFIVASVAESQKQGAGAEASAAPVLAQSAYDVANWYFSDLVGRAAAVAPPENAEAWTEFLGKLRGTTWRIDLHSALLHEYERNQGHLLSKGELDAAGLTQILRNQFGQFLKTHLERLGLALDKVPGLEPLPKRSPGLDALVQRLSEELRIALAGGGDRDVNVDVTVDALRDAPVGVLSSVKVKAHIRNYLWSEIGVVDGQPWRRLSPE